MNENPSPNTPGWNALSAEAFEQRIEDSMSLDENWLEITCPAVAEFLSEIDEDLIDDAELELLYFLATRVVAVCLPERSSARDVTADELWEVSGELLQMIEDWNDAGMALAEIPAELCKQSVQPQAIDFALSMLTEFSAEPNLQAKGTGVRPDAVIPMVTQLEAIMRCLKQHLA
jgi:hypothetical protein